MYLNLKYSVDNCADDYTFSLSLSRTEVVAEASLVATKAFRRSYICNNATAFETGSGLSANVFHRVAVYNNATAPEC